MSSSFQHVDEITHLPLAARGVAPEIQLIQEFRQAVLD
jgi:hypothetical protein